MKRRRKKSSTQLFCQNFLWTQSLEKVNSFHYQSFDICSCVSIFRMKIVISLNLQGIIIIVIIITILIIISIHDNHFHSHKIYMILNGEIFSSFSFQFKCYINNNMPILYITFESESINNSWVQFSSPISWILESQVILDDYHHHHADNWKERYS